MSFCMPCSGFEVSGIFYVCNNLWCPAVNLFLNCLGRLLNGSIFVCRIFVTGF
ncbi:unnamed protein product [Moneuplotes crassus]|uniref:Uncharacterized protein n=1 Tax=Euplotes crassus TaxID=5936 RepID=A0AAD1YA21_EUPCR|nr:unnamed protein product [Moneuplotes crassus]